MIEARPLAIAALFGALTRKARVLAQAHGENALRARRRDPRRWRRAALVWPLFNREP